MRRANKPMVALTLIFVILFTFTSIASAAANPPELPYQPPEQSREELYQDVFISLLLPTIQNEVDKYYLQYLTEPPMIAPYMIYVMSAERPEGYRTGFFRLKLRVDSYTGPHFSVGQDDITVAVTGSGNVKIEKFEHIKSFELPPRFKDMIREGYKNPIP